MLTIDHESESDLEEAHGARAGWSVYPPYRV